MADFSARLMPSGLTLTTWDDHEGAGASRINMNSAHPTRYQKATVGTQVEIRATVGGVEGPADSALGGRLFSSHLGEWSGSPPATSSPAGYSSIQRFTPLAVGHYLFVIAREDGGAMAFHLDAE